MQPFRFAVLLLAALGVSSGWALACSTQAVGCSETSDGRSNKIAIFNSTGATLPVGTWLYWKRTAGGDGRLTLAAALYFKSSVLVTLPLGAVSACTAIVVKP